MRVVDDEADFLREDGDPEREEVGDSTGLELCAAAELNSAVVVGAEGDRPGVADLLLRISFDWTTCWPCEDRLDISLESSSLGELERVIGLEYWSSPVSIIIASEQRG